MSTGRPSPLELERYLAGDLPPKQMERIRIAVESDTTLRADVERMQAENTALHGAFARQMGAAPAATMPAIEVSRRKPILLLLAAAAALLVAGLFVMSKLRDGNLSTPADGPQIAGGFVFLAAEGLNGEQPAALVQHMDTMLVSRVVVGGALDTALLREVRADGVVLERNGATEFLAADTLRRAAEAAADAEVTGWSQLHKSGNLGAPGVERLIALATWGHPGSITLLESVIETGGPEAERAEAFLGTLKEVRYLRDFVARALQPASPRRAEMLKSLAEDKRLIARDALRAVAENATEDESLRRVAVRLIGGLRDAWALRTLTDLERSLTDDDALLSEVREQSATVLRGMDMNDPSDGARE